VTLRAARRAAALAAVTALLAAATSGPASAGPPDVGILVPGRSLGGVSIGATSARVVSRWGAAYGRCRNCAVETLYFNRFAFRPEGAAVELGNGRVIAVFTLWAPPGWRTAQGLVIGEPTLRVEATYHPLLRTACPGYDAYTLPGRGARSVVYVVDGRVWGFALLGGGHPICL
jgi:hypothetical protein